MRKAARDFNVPPSTFKDRMHGKKPRNKAQEDSMNLTHNEESELVHWITLLTARDYAWRDVSHRGKLQGRKKSTG